MSNLIGTPVIAWSQTGVVEYGGLNDHPGMESTAYSYGRPHPVHYTDPDRVAPADTPIPASDERVRVVKYEGPKEYWMAGRWELRIRGVNGSWYYKTKRDAVAAGLRRVAILDHHASVTA